MTSIVCSLCEQVMTEDNAMEFSVDVPQIRTRITLRACVDCREKAKTHNLFLCLGCKSVTWFPSGTFLPQGVKYHVKFHCNRCVSEAVSNAVV